MPFNQFNTLITHLSTRGALPSRSASRGVVTQRSAGQLPVLSTVVAEMREVTKAKKKKRKKEEQELFKQKQQH